MTISIFVLKGDLNGGNRGGAFLFLSGIYEPLEKSQKYRIERADMVKLLLISSLDLSTTKYKPQLHRFFIIFCA